MKSKIMIIAAALIVVLSPGNVYAYSNPLDPLPSTANGTVHSDTQITVVTPVGTAGAVDVAVTTAGGITTLAGGYTYVTAPTISNLSPNAGLTIGGTGVTITGSGFMEAKVVAFGGINAASFKVDSDTEITAQTPAGTPGEVGIHSGMEHYSIYLSSGFTYLSS